jgi:hypothetical protein
VWVRRSTPRVSTAGGQSPGCRLTAAPCANSAPSQSVALTGLVSFVTEELKRFQSPTIPRERLLALLSRSWRIPFNSRHRFRVSPSNIYGSSARARQKICGSGANGAHEKHPSNMGRQTGHSQTLEVTPRHRTQLAIHGVSFIEDPFLVSSPKPWHHLTPLGQSSPAAEQPSPCRYKSRPGRLPGGTIRCFWDDYEHGPRRC